MDAPHIAWEKGGEARLVDLRDVQVVLHSTVPHPPGAPVTGTLVSSGLPVTVKVATSRTLGDGVWEVRGRLITATRAVLDACRVFLAKAD